MLIISTVKIDIIFSIVCCVKEGMALARFMGGNKKYAIGNLSQLASAHMSLLASLETIYRVQYSISRCAAKEKNVWTQWKWIIPWQQAW